MSLLCLYLTVLMLPIRASRWRCGGFERWDVSHRYDSGCRLSAGLQTEATQSVSAQKHICLCFFFFFVLTPDQTEKVWRCIIFITFVRSVYLGYSHRLTGLSAQSQPVTSLLTLNWLTAQNVEPTLNVSTRPPLGLCQVVTRTSGDKNLKDSIKILNTVSRISKWTDTDTVWVFL